MAFFTWSIWAIFLCSILIILEYFEDCGAPATFKGTEAADALSFGRRHLWREFHRGTQGRTRILCQQVSIVARVSCKYMHELIGNILQQALASKVRYWFYATFSWNERLLISLTHQRVFSQLSRLKRIHNYFSIQNRRSPPCAKWTVSPYVSPGA